VLKACGYLLLKYSFTDAGNSHNGKGKYAMNGNNRIFFSFAGLLSWGLVVCGATSVHIPVKVAVIGAGISGETAAYELKKQGFDVDVYEAKFRVGGRIFTIEMDGHITELGAYNLCDAGSADHILDLIDELGLTVETFSLRRFMSQYFDGHMLIDVRERMKQLACAPGELWRKLAEYEKGAYSMQDVLDRFFPHDPILHKIFSTKLADYEGAPVHVLSPLLIDSFYQRLLVGMRVSSAQDNEAVIFTQMCVKGGNYLITERLAERLGNSVHCGMALTRIMRDEKGVYHLTFANGEERTADVLVLTMPCPVYRNITIDADVITPEHLAHITSVQYGTNAKILLPSYGNHMRGVFTNGRMVCYLKEDVKTLVVYYVDEHGFFTESSIKHHFNKDVRLLRHIYNLPHDLAGMVQVADDSAQLVAYHGPVGHSWLNDPYAQGSYSCIGAGQEDIFTALEWNQGESVRSLFAPLHNNTLFFAGEYATVMIDHCGNMEAAVESAKRTARMITRCWKLSLV
jgi:monoamine oxidase